MMIIIYLSDAERKGLQGAKRPEPYAVAPADVQGSRVVSFVVILLRFPVDLRGPTHNTDAQNIA